MPRDPRAYLADIIASSIAIAAAIEGLNESAYEQNRLVRSAVEREFIIIGEALAALGRTSTALFEKIPNARRIVDFRNLLTHEYPLVDHALVWAIAVHEAPKLREICQGLMDI